MTDKMILNKRAHQKPLTLKPSINSDAIIIIRALITNKNKPKVRKVIGIVKKINTGLNTELRTAMTKATMSAVI